MRDSPAVGRPWIFAAQLALGYGALRALEWAWWRLLLRRREGAADFEEAAAAMSKAQVLEGRRRFFCAAQSVSYANSNPLMIVRGSGCWLVDEEGRRYLDTRNNVGHVGWQHPRVVAAVQRQLERENANTRYLHPLHVLLGRRLLETFAGALREGVVFFVNSGSEANDLALRLARAATGSRRALCVDHAYHGHTLGTLDVSPYKFQGKGGQGCPEGTTVVPCPDMYRGLHRSSGPPAEVSAAEEAALAERYAAHVARACDGPCAFIVESGMSVGGLVLPPLGYLRRCYASVRALGGVCIADEVQTGFGRFGEHFWAFEQQGVEPDIVTMGKPFGNGQPLAAVVCTRRIAETFADQKMEYFNTFGGNAASCAAGLAVLEAIERDGLRENATEVGKFLKDGFLRISRRKHGECIGDVRGCGLFLGVELVRDRERRTPAPEVLSVLCTRLLRRHRILTTIDGPQESVMVIKPPLCFGMEEARRFLGAVEEELRAMEGMDLSGAERTPT